LAWSPNGRFIAAGYGDGSVNFWSVSDPSHVSPAFTLPARPEKNGVYGLAWSHNGNDLAVPYGNGSVEIWNVQAPQPVRVSNFENKHIKEPYFVAWSQDDKEIASVGTDHWLRVWDVVKGEDVWKVNLHDSVFSVSWSQNGEYIAATVKDDSVHVYKAQDGSLVAVGLGVGSSFMYGSSWAPDSRRLVTADYGNHIYIWQLP